MKAEETVKVTIKFKKSNHDKLMEKGYDILRYSISWNFPNPSNFKCFNLICL